MSRPSIDTQVGSERGAEPADSIPADDCQGEMQELPTCSEHSQAVACAVMTAVLMLGAKQNRPVVTLIKDLACALKLLVSIKDATSNVLSTQCVEGEAA